MTPPKIAFVHFGKCGGVFMNVYLSRFLGSKNYVVRNSWNTPTDKDRGLGRDWNPEDLREFLASPEPLHYVHNHHINWPWEVVSEFLKKGWFVFTFIRPPADLISSLYFWGCNMTDEGRNPFSVSGIDPRKYSVDEFFTLALFDQGFRRLWVLPEFVPDLSHVGELGTENFSGFLREKFGHEYGEFEMRARHRNASGSPGFRELVASGEIGLDTINAFYLDPDVIAYEKFLTLWEPPLLN